MTSKPERIRWQTLAPIFADVVISPWNLLVGGLLIRYLSFSQAFISVVVGYGILAAVFVLYGGLGFLKQQQSSEILGAPFGKFVRNFAIPLVLACGQIGWAAINIDLGGRSLSSIFSWPAWVGIIFYVIFLIVMGSQRLYNLGIVKTLIIISSVGLLVYLTVAKLTVSSFGQLVTYQPTIERSLFWGISIVVASLISFSTVTPDFFQSVKTKRDIVLSTAFGLCIPGMLTALLGCFLFFDKGNFDLIALISGLTFSLFPHIFNTLTNTDGAIALYTPALKFKSMWNMSFYKGILLAGCISLILALSHITSYLEPWLKFLSIAFPIFIGITFPALLFQGQPLLGKVLLFSSLGALALALFLITSFPPVVISLVAPIVIATLSIYYYIYFFLPFSKTKKTS